MAWLQPKDDQQQVWVLVFDDPDCNNIVVREEDEAIRLFEQYDPNWNCYLLTSVPNKMFKTDPETGRLIYDE